MAWKLEQFRPHWRIVKRGLATVALAVLRLRRTAFSLPGVVLGGVIGSAAASAHFGRFGVVRLAFVPTRVFGAALMVVFLGAVPPIAFVLATTLCAGVWNVLGALFVTPPKPLPERRIPRPVGGIRLRMVPRRRRPPRAKPGFWWHLAAGVGGAVVAWYLWKLLIVQVIAWAASGASLLRVRAPWAPTPRVPRPRLGTLDVGGWMAAAADAGVSEIYLHVALAFGLVFGILTYLLVPGGLLGTDLNRSVPKYRAVLGAAATAFGFLALPALFAGAAAYGLTSYAFVHPSYGGGAAQVVRFGTRTAAGWTPAPGLPAAAALLDQDGQVVTILACDAPAPAGSANARIPPPRHYVRTVLLSEQVAMAPVFVPVRNETDPMPPPAAVTKGRRDAAGRDVEPAVTPLPAVFDSAGRQVHALAPQVCVYLTSLDAGYGAGAAGVPADPTQSTPRVAADTTRARAGAASHPAARPPARR